MKERGERPTPVAIEKELAGFERLAAALAAIDAVEHAGGTVAHYHSVDLTDAEAVAQVLEARSGSPATGSTCCCTRPGVEVSRPLPDKEPREFDLVFGVKADGWFNVLHGRRGPADRADRRRSPPWPAGSATPGRPTTAPPTTCCARSPAACGAPDRTPGRSRSTGPPGVASAWPPGGRSRRSWRWPASRCCRPRPAWPGSVGSSPGTGSAGEVVVAGELGRMADGYHPTGGVDAGAIDTSTAGAAWSGEVVEARRLATGSWCETTLDPADAAVPRRPPHRRHRPCCPA